ncbi:hypothetical protein pb186bvf_016272 [Paramecium bursaria]
MLIDIISKQMKKSKIMEWQNLSNIKNKKMILIEYFKKQFYYLRLLIENNYSLPFSINQMSNNQNLPNQFPNNTRIPQQGPQFQFIQQGDPNQQNNMNPLNAPPQQFNPQGGMLQNQQFQIPKPGSNLQAPQQGSFYGQQQINQQGGQPQNPIQFPLPGFQGANPPPFVPGNQPNFTIQFPQPGRLPVQDTAKKDEQIKKLNTELEDVKNELEESEAQVSKIRSELTSTQTKLRIEKEESDQKDLRIRQMEEEFQSAKDKWKRDKDQQIQKQSSTLKAQHQQEIEDLETEIQKLKQQISVFQTGNKDAQQLELQNQIYELQEKLKKEQRINRELQSKISSDGQQDDDKTNQNIIELQEQLFQAKLEIEKKHKHFTDELEKNRDSQSKINSLVIQLSQRDEGLEVSQKHLKKINKELNETKTSLQEKEDDYKQLQLQISNLKQENDQLIQQISKSKDKESEKLFLEMQKTRELLEQEQKRMIEEREQAKNQKRLEEEQKILQKAQQEKQQRDYNLQKTAAERQKLGQLMRNKAIGSMGEMEVCFVVDVTSSMDPYKKQTEDCIVGSVDAIKKETGRNARWSTVAYQDIDEWKKNKNQYLQHDFVEDSKKILDFLKSTKCVGGDDYCEDVKGGLDQMIEKLSWKTKFRVAVLICDAPAHGSNVNMGCGDKYPNDDISDVINKMIDKEIVFIVIQFIQWTQKMIQHIKNLYNAKGKPELFITIDLQTIKIEEVWKSLIDIIKEASAVATGVKNSASKVKGNQKARPKTKDGAMEALCKEKNFKNFDQKADICVENDFQVFRVDLKEKAFEDNILSIQNINNADFQTFEEGKWKCIRTKEPFAFGMMKSVYLMKKKNDPQNHLYVIKMPLEGFYETLDYAKGECRSHLICKNLMRKFMKTLREKHEQKNKPHNQYPEIYYSDFLILQENERKFWIAERFFDGEFIKYNNNWGFIDDKLTPMNQLAQAFTQFTYYISNFQYMINDVQGVGVYFTDPAVNTSSGDYDDTDMGVDGQSMYMVSFEHKKHISRDILEVMDILIE